MEVEARAPLVACLGRTGNARIFRALSEFRVARLLIHRPIIPKQQDLVAAAAAAAIAPPAGYRLVMGGGPSGPGQPEADAMAALGALNVLAERVRSPTELAAVAVRLGRRVGVDLDEDGLLACALGGLVLVRQGPDGPQSQRIRPPRRAGRPPAGLTVRVLVATPGPGA